MKKAKNALAIIGIVFAVIAAALLVLHPVIDGVAAALSEDPTPAMGFGEYLGLVTGRIPQLFDFGWISSFSLDALKINFPIIVAAVGVILLIVLLIIMLCKKHAKGLGWWVVMLVMLGVSVVVASVYVKPNNFYDVYFGKVQELSYSSFVVNKYLFIAGLVCAIVASAAIIIASIFYMVYVCKASKKAKKVDDARNAALAKIESLLGGNN